VQCAIMTPWHDQLVVSSAGHPPPVVTSPDAPAEVVDLPADLPVGVAARPRRATTLCLPPGHGLFLYTDGLVERRGVSLDVGLRKLCAALRPGPADAVCATVMAQLLGGDQAADDVAVLMLSRPVTDATEPLVLRHHAVPLALRQIRNLARQWLSGVGVTVRVAEEFLIALGEACANVVEHAYGPRGGMISVRLVAEPSVIVAVVRDHGHWRSPRGHNRGRGTVLMHGFVDEVRIEHLVNGTEVTLRKIVSTEEAG
jgi:anti-sigma regulatory factor (Ser/Thr protein kinase)